ncbi:MAG: sigma-54-dependent Fis family transcriptional regulator [Nitrospirae bacterium]|nr:MAG: sigma-54-dependent Fis family transcriptional regulator [Nitrospirota bacterium]
MADAPAKILIVDDERGMREVLTTVLERAGYQVSVAENGEKALSLAGGEIFDVILTDLKMPGGMGGLEVLRAVKDASPDTLVIVLTAFATLEVGIEAMKLGAYDVLPKPFSNDHVELSIRKALEAKRLKTENQLLKLQLKGQASFSNLIGTSEPMQKVFALIRRVADASSTVLICGESGTGKELVAKAIHYHSPLRDCAFVTVNCAALPEPLLESELFGHMRGSFTGAVSNKEGLFEVADGGTLFLDEIAETPPGIQAKLLRVIQEREFRRIGGTRNIKVNVRILAATNQDLNKAVAEGRFREDLYYRLEVIPITLPPLRSRPEDVPLLVHHFLTVFGQRVNKPALKVSSSAMRALQEHEWKGNVRELENVMERVVALTAGDVIQLEDVGQWLRDGARQTASLSPALPHDGLDLEEMMNGLERDLLLKALERTGWVKKKAARLLKLNARSFRYRLDKYGIKRANGADVEGDEEDGEENE